MRDRVKIIVNNKEVAKRYVGDRLVWSSGPLVLFEGTLELSVYNDNYYIGPTYKMNIKDFSKIKSFQIDGKDIFKLTSYQFRLVQGSYIGISVYEPGIQEYFEIPPNFNRIKYIKIKFYGE